MNPNNFGRGQAAPVVSGPVLQVLAELRYVTPRQVAERLNGRFTLKQVNKALLNAKGKGLVESSGVVRIKGLKGGAPATYWKAGDEPPPIEVDEDVDLFEPNREHPLRPQYASIWDYARLEGEQAQRRISSVWDLA